MFNNAKARMAGVNSPKGKDDNKSSPTRRSSATKGTRETSLEKKITEKKIILYSSSDEDEDTTAKKVNKGGRKSMVTVADALLEFTGMRKSLGPGGYFEACGIDATKVDNRAQNFKDTICALYEQRTDTKVPFKDLKNCSKDVFRFMDIYLHKSGPGKVPKEEPKYNSAAELIRFLLQELIPLHDDVKQALLTQLKSCDRNAKTTFRFVVELLPEEGFEKFLKAMAKQKDIWLYTTLLFTYSGSRCVNLFRVHGRQVHVSDTELMIIWTHRKTDATGKRQRVIITKYSMEPVPPKEFIEWINDRRENHGDELLLKPVLGTKTKISTMSSSLSKEWTKRYKDANPSKENQRVSVKHFRRRLDRICREKMTNGEITEDEYTALMDHSKATSDAHYGGAMLTLAEFSKTAKVKLGQNKVKLPLADDKAFWLPETQDEDESGLEEDEQASKGNKRKHASDEDEE